VGVERRPLGREVLSLALDLARRCSIPAVVKLQTVKTRSASFVFLVDWELRLSTRAGGGRTCQRRWEVCNVSVMKSLWASIQGNPVFMRRVNGWLTIFWIVMIPVSIVAGWLDSVTYVSALSLWALVSGHWSAWQAARVEVVQQHEIEEREQNPPEDRIVEKLVEETTLQPSGTHG
jgi:hypothetical protein